MSRPLPPLDVHAHLRPDIDPRELEGLGAVVLAATRSPDEFAAVRDRSDLVTVWGLGCHPGVEAAQATFDVDHFSALLKQTPLISEVGLDGSSPVPMDRQRETFAAILELLTEPPRLVSVHSRGATSQVLDLVERSSVRNLMLHWWLGSSDETERALRLGCHFSVNHAMAARHLPGLLRLVPPERIVLETDHPDGDRRSPRPRQPGSLTAVEETMAQLWDVTAVEVRRRSWQNFAALVNEAGVRAMLPAPIRLMLKSL